VCCSKVTEDSVLAVQIFDQKKFKKKDQGFLGVVNVRIGNVIDLDAGGDGKLYPPSPWPCVCHSRTELV
jgi:E3 ubiquitin-protein ligase NEDD4